MRKKCESCMHTDQSAPFDFAGLSGWEEFQDLCADLLVVEGFYNVRPGGSGTDRGIDINAEEDIGGSSDYREKVRWLVQCKHYAGSGKSVGEKEIAEIQDYLEQHNADGLFILTDTHLTATAVQKIETFDRTKRHSYRARFWDHRDLTQRLLRHPTIAEEYFPLVRSRTQTTAVDLYTFRDPAAAWYVTRDEERKFTEVLNRFSANRTQNLFITGPSGVGKSSFLNRTEQLLKERQFIPIRRTVMLENPQELVVALAEDVRDHLSRLKIQEPPKKESAPNDLLQCTSRLVENSKCPVVFLVDQFERIFEHGSNWDEHAIKSSWRAFVEIIRPTLRIGLVTWIVAAREHYYFILFPDEATMRYTGFSWISLSELPRHKAIRLVGKLLSLCNRSMTPSAVEVLVEGASYFPQNLILSFIRLCETLPDTKEISQEAVHEIRPWLDVFESDFGRLQTEEQRLAVLAMAHTQKEVCTIGEVKIRVDSQMHVSETKLREVLRTIQDEFAVIRQPKRDHFCFYHSAFGRHLFDRHYGEFPSKWLKFEGRLVREETTRRDFNDYLSSLVLEITHQMKSWIALHNLSVDQLKQSRLQKDTSKAISNLDSVGRMIQKTFNALSALGRRSRSMMIETVDLVQVVQKTVELLQRKFSDTRISLRWKIPAGVFLAQAEPIILQQVFVNLLMNSIDAMSTGGTLTLRFSTNIKSNTIEITDTGCGIPQSMLAKIWEIGFTTKEKGMGFGLYIVRKIVEEFNGKLSIESAEGKGTTVKVEFPRFERDHQPTKEESKRWGLVEEWGRTTRKE